MIEEANFIYSPLGKAFEKQIKTIKDQGEKQVKTFPEHGNQLVESCEIKHLVKYKIQLNKLILIICCFKDEKGPKCFIRFKGPTGVLIV